MPFKKLLATTAVVAGGLSLATPAQAEVEPFIGEITAYGFTFCPRGWAEAAGQIMSISQNTALFSLLGTTYGGNGQTTFALPDLRGRVAIGAGQGPGLSNYSIGERAGTETMNLLQAQMPAHTHTGALRAVSSLGDTNNPTGNSMARAPAGATVYSTADPGNNMNAGDVVVGATGGNQPIGKVSPLLVARYCIALQGIFPSRN